MLTEKKIARLMRTAGRYHDRDGLYLRVKGSSASWMFRFEVADDRPGREGKRRERWLGLGSYRAFNLKEARRRAREQRQLRADGVDPVEVRKAKKAERALSAAKAMTFRQCAEAYIAANEHTWRSVKHAKQWPSTLATYVYPVLGNLPVADIDIGLVLKCIEPNWSSKTETMSRVRGRIESVLDWATVRKYRVGDNPARWDGYLEHALPSKSKLAAVVHHAAMPYAELGVFMGALREREGVAARALEFLILSCARAGEILGARWPEIDLDARMWTVPATRMKSGKEHRVALSERAVELLRSLPTEAGNDLVFIGGAGRGLPDKALTAVLRGIRDNGASVHGFRSTFRDWAAERTNFSREVCELALAHATAGRVEAAYQRADLLRKRRALAEAWSKYTSAPVAAEGGEVVPLRV
jgi:integrase